jgi:hypothetical protein
MQTIKALQGTSQKLIANGHNDSKSTLSDFCSALSHMKATYTHCTILETYFLYISIICLTTYMQSQQYTPACPFVPDNAHIKYVTS